jgi:acyl-CoA synthetase (AMP-forming)/AMP-acid ligase II
VLRRPPLHYPDRPFHHFLDDAADRHPEAIGLRFGDESFTYRDLEGLTNAFGHALLELGVAVGDRVALVVPNRPEWLIAELGVSKIGGAVVMPNAAWRPAELGHALALTAPRVVVAAGPSASVVDEVYPEAEIRIGLDDDLPDGWLSFWDLIYNSPGTRFDPVVEDWGDLEAALPFSSGTTGLPKAVRHTHRSLVAGTIGWKAASTIGEDDRLQFFLPLFHIYGICTIACAFASSAPLTLFGRFDLDTMLSDIESEQITIGFAAAPIAVAMANHPDLERYDLSSLRYLLWAATPIVPDVAESVSARTGVPWLHAYGTTEAPCLHCNPVHHPDRWRLDSPGLPLSDLQVRIVDIESRVAVSGGETGEILIRGPQVMAGYLPEEANDEVFEDGWLRTGDIGWVEPEGWIHITDRAKEMIKVNAFQVAPAELEVLLHSHPAVADCAVYGVPDPRTGETPKAAVVLRAGALVSEQELVEFVAEQVATYKRIHTFDFVDEIPRNASGKVLRRVLRDADPVVGSQ